MAKKRNYPKYTLRFAGNTVQTGKRKPKKVLGPHTILLNRTPAVTLSVEVEHKKAHGGAPNLLITINKERSAGKGSKKQ